MQAIKSIISELISLSKVDGKISDDEVALIKTMGNMLGLSDPDLLALFEHPVPFNPQVSHYDRMVQFHRLVLVMCVDGYPDEVEKNHLRLMGVKLGLNPGAIEEIFVAMTNYADNVIPPDELIEIYKKHMN